MRPPPVGRGGWVRFRRPNLGSAIFVSCEGLKRALPPVIQGPEECVHRDSALAQLKEMFPAEDDDYLRDVLGSRKHDVPAAMQVHP